MAITALPMSCDPCKDCGEEQVPVAFCLECREVYCKICLNCHKRMTVTNSHSFVYLSGDESKEIYPCDLCDSQNNFAQSLCSICRQLYCTACTNRHRKLKATKNHMIVKIFSDKSTVISSELEEACDLHFHVSYFGKQFPVDKKDKQNQQDGKFVSKVNTNLSVPDNTNIPHGSEPLHFDITVRQSDMKLTSLSGTFHCQFYFSTPSDKRSIYINRMISMPDGRICVVNFYEDKIKLYTDNYVSCDEVSVPGCTAITCVDNDTVAVATDSDITRLSVKANKITRTESTLHIDSVVIFDIAYRRGEFITRYNKDNRDYTCCGSKLIVKQDRKLFLCDCMRYDPFTDCVILGNSLSTEENNITCYTLNGEVRWKVTLDGEPRGMVVVRGVVLLADYDNNTIRQIGMNGRLLLSPLLTKDYGITRPYAIAYQHKQHRLLVSRYKDDNVMVFNLSQ